jgi:Cu/Ag efflux protein CusF
MNNRLLRLIPVVLIVAIGSMASTLHAQTGSTSAPPTVPKVHGPSDSTASTATNHTTKVTAGQSAAYTISGKVIAVDFKARTFTLQRYKSFTKDTLKTFHTSDETTYQFQGHETHLNDLKRGLEIQVKYEKEGDKAVAANVQICDCSKCAVKCDCCPHEDN